MHLKRGLLVADRYFLAQGASNADDPDANRSLAIYDISKDCRKPKLLADVVMPTAVGHEGCFQADGMVYYMASTDTITPIDISDPTKPEAALGAAAHSGSTAARPARTASARYLGRHRHSAAARRRHQRGAGAQAERRRSR